MKTQPKFAGPMTKKKPKAKNHITKKEYRDTSAARVDDSLNKFFKTAGKVSR